MAKKFVAPIGQESGTPRRGIHPRLRTGGTLFEELGFYYVGPIDGHNLDV
jgi:1-deoxy-D-xylulose-5-phosphate synthase